MALGGIVADTANPTLSGTAEANDEVLLLEGNTIVGTGTADGGGGWDIETGALGLGYHNIAAESIDADGNISPVSGADTIEVVPPPPGEVTLNDAAMIGADDLSAMGTISAPTGAATEYGPISVDGFTFTDLNRPSFSFITWNSAWTIVHNVSNVAEYYDGPDVLIVPTDGIIAPGSSSGYNPVASAVADTIDLKRADGAAFSLVSIDIGPTGDYPTSAVFTGTTAGGQTIKETVELNLLQNSPLQPVALSRRRGRPRTQIGWNRHARRRHSDNISQFDPARELSFALQSGQLPASGIRPTAQSRSQIPKEYWNNSLLAVRDHADADSIRYLEQFIYKDLGYTSDSMLVMRNVVLRIWTTVREIKIAEVAHNIGQPIPTLPIGFHRPDWTLEHVVAWISTRNFTALGLRKLAEGA